MDDDDDDDDEFFCLSRTSVRPVASYMLYSYFHHQPCFDASLLLSSNPTMPDWIVVFSSLRSCGLLLTW